MRTTTPGRLELAGRRRGAERLLRRPAQRVEDLAGVDHRLEPGAALGRPLHRQEQREQALLVRRAGVLAQGLAERQVLGLAVRGEPVGVGREEGERRLLVLAVLGEVEVDAADEVPGRVQPLEELLRARRLTRASSVAKAAADLVPQRLEDGGGQVLGARSSAARRRRAPPARRAEAAGAARPAAPSPSGRRAERGHEAATPARASRRRPAGSTVADLAGAELQQPVAGPALEGLAQPLAEVLGESAARRPPREVQPPVRRERGARAAPCGMSGDSMRPFPDPAARSS